jgi:hypothetical protein
VRVVQWTADVIQMDHSLDSPTRGLQYAMSSNEIRRYNWFELRRIAEQIWAEKLLPRLRKPMVTAFREIQVESHLIPMDTVICAEIPNLFLEGREVW